MGEPRKTNSHSPLEILPGLYTAIFKEGQPQPRKLQGLSYLTRLNGAAFTLTKLALKRIFL